MEEKEVKVESTEVEQLKREVEGFKSMNNQLIMQLQQMNMTNLFKRLDYMFKVVEFKDAFNTEFVNKCTNEIEGHIMPPETEEEPNK